MPFKKLDDAKQWHKRLCQSPEHNPPGHIVLEPGTYEWQCPACKQTLIITVPMKPFL